MVELLKPKRGGFLRPFGCAWFIREYLLGRGPHGSPKIDPAAGAPQADIFHEYKMALIKATAMDRATRAEEKKARREKRLIDPDNILALADKYTARLPYKKSFCTYHSFSTYFSSLRKLAWVEATGEEEDSEFQDHYSKGQPRKFYCLTVAGKAATDVAWANPLAALYG